MNCQHCDVTLPSEAATYCPACGQPSRTRPGIGRRAANRTRLADREESILWRASFSGKGLIHSWMLAVAISFALPIGALVVAAGRTEWLVIATVVGLIWVGLGVLLGVRKLNVHYELSDQRLIHRSGILLRRTHRIELIDIDDVAHEQDLIERMFNVGTIEIISSDRSHPVMELPGIDRVEHVAMLIDDARRRERIRRGIHIEQI